MNPPSKSIVTPCRRVLDVCRAGLLAMAGLFAFTLPIYAQDTITGSSWSQQLSNPALIDQWLQSLPPRSGFGGGFISPPGGNITAMAEAGTYSQWALGTSNLPEVYVAPDSSNPTGSVPNLLRYAMNLDLTGQGALLPQPVVVFTDSGPELSITYRQRKLMPDVTLVPQYTNDLKNWTDVPAEDITQLPDDDINTARYIAEMPLPAGQALYLRVIAEPNNGPVTQWPVSAGGNGHYYQAIVGLDITAIRSAESYAISHGGYLVTITSADENNFVFNLANSPRFWTNADGNSVGPLLGIETGVTPTALNNLRWVNNEGPLTFTNWAFLPVFNSRSGYAGVQFYGSGVSNPQATWSFFVDGPIPSFVVEYDTNPAGN